MKAKNNSTEFIMNMTLTFRYSDGRLNINLTGANKSRQYKYIIIIIIIIRRKTKFPVQTRYTGH